MTDCAECGGSLEGAQVIADPDGPLDPGDPIPYEGPLFDKVVGFVICPNCGSERPCRPKDWWANQDPENFGPFPETL